MAVLSKKGFGLRRMFLGDFLQGSGESFHDHVVAVGCEQGTDFCYFEEVVRVSASAERDGADERGASLPAVFAAGPCCDRFVGECAPDPHRAGENHGETIDRRPAVESFAELQEVVDRMSFGGRLVMTD